MKGKKSRDIIMAVAMFAVIGLAGCAAQKGPILVGAEYEAPQGLAPAAPKVVVGLSPFKDARGGKPSVIGVRENNAGQFENDLVVQGTVSDLVTAAIKKALKARNITVKDLPAWDLNVDHLNADNVDIVLGGTVVSLWATVVTQPLKTTAHVDATVHAVMADARDKTVVRELDMHGTFDDQYLTFDPEKVGEALSSALSSMVDQLMNDPEFKKKVQ